MQNISPSIELTNETDMLICQIYKHYLELRKVGEPREKAKFIGGVEMIKKHIDYTVSDDDIADFLRELHSADFIECLYADDRPEYCTLTNKAIIYMEQRFKNNIQSVIDAIVNLRTLLPI